MSFRLRVNKRSVIPSTFPTLQPFQKVGWNPGHPFYQASLILRVVEIHGISLSTVAGFLLNSLVWTSIKVASDRVLRSIYYLFGTEEAFQTHVLKAFY